jgi:hypothetical protein
MRDQHGVARTQAVVAQRRRDARARRVERRVRKRAPGSGVDERDPFGVPGGPPADDPSDVHESSLPKTA